MFITDQMLISSNEMGPLNLGSMVPIACCDKACLLELPSGIMQMSTLQTSSGNGLGPKHKTFNQLSCLCSDPVFLWYYIVLEDDKQVLLPQASMAGRTLNMRKGVTTMPTMAGTMAALNQVTQGDATSTPSSEASFMHSRFWAAAVRNRAEECTDVCIWDCTRNEPSFSEDGSSAQAGYQWSICKDHGTKTLVMRANGRHFKSCSLAFLHANNQH